MSSGPAAGLAQGAAPGGVRPGGATGWRPGSSCRSAGCGSSRTRTCRRRGAGPAVRHTASGSSCEEFGVETEEVWLPDSFGYTGRAAPADRAGGSRWFLTQKISWNRTNRFPHHTFWWEGIDGTRIFTHFPPVDTYNSELSGAAAGARVAQLRGQGLANRVAGAVRLGATAAAARRAEMLARARRLRDLDGSPRVRDRAAGRRSSPAPRPSIRTPRCGSGELYLESAPRHLHLAGARPSRATGAASTCCARPSCGRPPPPSAPGTAYPYDAAGPALEDGAAAAVPRHPARLVDRLGAPRGRGQLRRGRRRARGDHRRRCAARSRGAGRPTAGSSSTPPRTPATASRRIGRRASRRPPPAARRGQHRDRRRLRARQRPAAGGGRRRGLLTSVLDWPTGARCSPRRAAATCCSCTRTAERLGRLGRRRVLPHTVTRPRPTSPS